MKLVKVMNRIDEDDPKELLINTEVIITIKKWNDSSFEINLIGDMIFVDKNDLNKIIGEKIVI